MLSFDGAPVDVEPVTDLVWFFRIVVAISVFRFSVVGGELVEVVCGFEPKYFFSVDLEEGLIFPRFAISGPWA